MLGSRTKQVLAYGRRGHRIVNVSDRRDEDQPVDEPRAVSPGTAPIRKKVQRENAIILSPARPRVLRKPKRSGILDTPIKAKSTRDLPLKVDTANRQPLTPVRLNGVSPASITRTLGKKGKSCRRLSLKSHSPQLAVDIILLDEAGKTVCQERRVSHTDVQTNVTHISRPKTYTGKCRDAQPIVVSDDSETETPMPPKRSRRDTHRLISSDKSETEFNAGGRARRVRPLSTEKSIPRVEVVIPSAPYKIVNIQTKTPPPVAYQTAPRQVPLREVNPVPLTLLPPPTVSKPRQLTPIRRSSNRTTFAQQFLTPSTPTEVDLSLELAQLDISDVAAAEDQSYSPPNYLLPLLNECSQTCPHEFSAFIETFPFDPVVQSVDADVDVHFRKIGEASFSEVFGIGDVVLKVIPIQNEDKYSCLMAETPPSTDAKDVLKEIIVTRAMGALCRGFVKLLKTYVVRGKYPTLFLELWDEYNEKKGSESVRPDSFALDQMYAIIVLPNGGPDLESFVFKSPSKYGWQQACGVFWQVARALAQAEDLVHFEHRDLHWGQILVRSVPVKKSQIRGNKYSMDDTRFGVKTTIIDLGLSRMDASDPRDQVTYWTSFDDDIFEGEGDYQYDIYRMMVKLNRGGWDRYQPFTNVMWLHYLVLKLLYSKRLRPPGTRKKAVGEGRIESPTGYDEQECYDCLVEVERLLGQHINLKFKVQKGSRKTVAPLTNPESAQDVVAYAEQRGWI
ncbi:hypothetical protein F5J12DRAFT_790723 [Pisolithus orientalis]|uniref:uncharacterized protein n=1 Tax=Pisolithus orientalis TaxID=936130 RepID=UPI0022257C3C|nr:uncharacterized protein F5J12DRAFT_790723 [Pisolithus orientalis]KAI6035053.1 hypothetical protein F5J12DRAFT_790723 [Pisolithus orientalis]